MGKIPPPCAPPNSPSPSSNLPLLPPHPPLPLTLSPIPNLPTPLPSPSQKSPQKEEEPFAQAPSPLAPRRLPPTSNPPSTFNSLSATTAKASASLHLATLLRSFCDASASPTNALTLFRHISSRLSTDRTSFHVLLGHSCLRTLGGDEDDQLSHVFNVFDLMSTSGFNPNATSADLAVCALCSAAQLDDACALLRLLSSFSSPTPILRDAFIYNFLIRRLARICPVSFIYAFIDELRRSFGTRPNLVTYTILIDVVCCRCNLRKATRLLDILSDSGFKTDCYLYNTIMKGYCMVDQCSKVMETLDLIRDRNFNMLTDLCLEGQFSNEDGTELV